jgi:hypothetical protein
LCTILQGRCAGREDPIDREDPIGHVTRGEDRAGCGLVEDSHGEHDAELLGRVERNDVALLNSEPSQLEDELFDRGDRALIRHGLVNGLQEHTRGIRFRVSLQVEEGVHIVGRIRTHGLTKTRRRTG